MPGLAPSGKALPGIGGSPAGGPWSAGAGVEGQGLRFEGGSPAPDVDLERSVLGDIAGDVGAGDGDLEGGGRRSARHPGAPGPGGTLPSDRESSQPTGGALGPDPREGFVPDEAIRLLHLHPEGESGTEGVGLFVEFVTVEWHPRFEPEGDPI